MQFKHDFPFFEQVIISTENLEIDLFFSRERKYPNQEKNN